MKMIILLSVVVAFQLSVAPVHGESVADVIERVEKKLDSFMSYILKKKGWYKASDTLWYKLQRTEKLNYEGAKAACANMGVQLASVGMRSFTIRSKLMEDLWKPLGATFWIGLDDLKQQFHWMWLDGVESTSSNTDWAKQGVVEPNNVGGIERCATLDHRRWALNDDMCHHKYYYLCELSL